jgi:hypothetical protein
MCIGMTASMRFGVAPTPSSSAMPADLRAQRPSIDEKLVTPERTNSNIPAAFLTFLFARLHADAEPKAKKQEISVRRIRSVQCQAAQKCSFPVDVVSCPGRTPLHPIESPGWVNFRTPAATSQW